MSAVLTCPHCGERVSAVEAPLRDVMGEPTMEYT